MDDLGDFIFDDSLSDCSFLSEPDDFPHSINIDLSNGCPLDKNDFIVVHYNIDSILAEGRLEQLGDVCRSMSVDCLVITESKLDSSIPDNLLKIINFHDPLRRDRNRHGGGCLVYVAEHLTFSHITKSQANKYEHLWVDINCNNKIYSVNAFYRPSTDNTAEKYEEFLSESEIILDNLKNRKSDIKIIASDLNFGNVYCKQPVLLPKPLDNTAPELFASYGFHQLIDIPTRVRENTTSLVDLFFVPCLDTVKSHGTLPPIADHDGIFTSFLSVKTQHKSVKRTVYDYKNTDEKGLLKYISEYNYQSTVFSKPVPE